VNRLAADGVSCSLCHQIGKEKLGTPESFVGGFTIQAATPEGGRPVYGPFKIDAGGCSHDSGLPGGNLERTVNRPATSESFVGGFTIQAATPEGGRPVYGPFKIDAGQTRIMRTSSGGFKPTEAEHIRQSEVCATCHTLITKALGPQG